VKKTLLVCVFLGGLLLLSGALNIILFQINETNKTIAQQATGQITNLERQNDLLQQRFFLCETILQECLSLPEDDAHLFVRCEENSQTVLTAQETWLH